MKKSIQTHAALYCRISKGEEAKVESNSIANQKILLQKAAQLYGYEHTHFYVDDGYSGTDFDRPALKEMQAAIEVGLISAVLVKDVSRLGRDYLKVGYYTEQLFPKHRVRFIAVGGNIDSQTDSTDFLPFYSVMDEWYAKDISRKLRTMYKARAAKGEPIGAPVYGYIKSTDNPRRWEPDYKAALVVKRIYHLALQGYGVDQIAAVLENEQILTPAHYRLSQNRNGGGVKNPYPYKWRSSTVTQILNRQEYCGDVINQKTYSNSYKDKQRHRNDRDKMSITKNVHEAIIERPIWELVQQKRSKSLYKKTGKQSLFSGFMRCGDCDSNMHYHFNQQNPSIQYYNCSNYVGNRGTCSDTHYIRLDYLEPLVLKEINRVLEIAHRDWAIFVKKIEAVKSSEIKKQESKYRTEYKSIMQRQDEISSLIANLYEERMKGDVDDEIFGILVNKFKAEREQIRGKCEKLQTQISYSSHMSNRLKLFKEVVLKTSYIKQLTREVLHEIIDYIAVYPAKKGSGVKEQKIDVHFQYIGQIKI